MIVRPNDDYYGSDFTKIMRVVDILNEQGFIRPDFVDYDDCSNLGKELGTLDDITTHEDWQPGAECSGLYDGQQVTVLTVVQIDFDVPPTE